MSRLRIARPPANSGLAWVKSGWTTFRSAPVVWSGMTAMAFMLVMGIGMLPYVGGLLLYALSPFLVAGYLAASRAGERGEPVTFLHLGAGSASGHTALFGIGFTYMAVTLGITQVVHMATGTDFQALLALSHHPQEMTPAQAEAFLDAALPALGLGFLLLTPLLMATWFSPGLAHFEEYPAGKAMWWSLWACWVNWRPMLYYSTILVLAGMAALMIPLGLGLLIFLPVTLASTYAAYRDIFIPIDSSEHPDHAEAVPPPDDGPVPDFDPGERR